MKNTVRYEWTIEQLDEHGDIIDSSFFDEYPTQQISQDERLGLVRYEGNEIEGVTLMLWAYVDKGKLPIFFENESGEKTEYKVPIKFINFKNK